ncbi:hypothetical protein F5B22DRAFT_601300 [Xylaria bambusicola]|uniref:uncharacterized protein n=1 Tax=Xylaria bambusicola TaxID=326684 RepID=UPI002008326F|nr:uncharacterized protein F5B22DRAFT_601300 [Xylaria bambusicola]KAI0517983.1 hypothetical protein F5B22DRAFT_601300 [Xylaria bambusicola]
MPDGTSLRPTRFLIPARSSRHRIACLALYRALLRLAPQISLPDDLATGWGPGKNPVAIHIRRAFKHNVGDTSPRILYPALSAGYRMLSVLHDAATAPNSEHHASIIKLLQSRLEERKRSLANRPAPRPSYDPESDRPRPGTIPLIVKVSPPPNAFGPTSKPTYAIPTRPRPLSELGGTGKRKVPHIDMASDIPFLRLTKPQPAILSRVLRQKVNKRIARTELYTALQKEALPNAKIEDAWDAEIERLMLSENKSESNKNKTPGKRSSGGGLQDSQNGIDGGSYAETIQRHGTNELLTILTTERMNEVARADAMRQIVNQEKALAAQEKAQRTAERRARWEAKMLEQHGEGWRELFPHFKERKAKPAD